ncbi:MAG: Zn-ribbon domain-containing OB-fold protein [Desulfobacteraceae bacterium]|nr:MAG: Zn-ribbon domain-containing OB-fold protein [Desulfobacteraceae bacterium]
MNEKRSLPVKENLFEFGRDGTGDIKLLGSRCIACGEKHFPQKSICPNCSGRRLNKIYLSESGAIVTYTVVRQASPLWRGRVPYVIAVVKLDDGTEISSHLVGCNPETIRIGARVRVVAGKLRENDDGDDIIAHMFEII